MLPSCRPWLFFPTAGLLPGVLGQLPVTAPSRHRIRKRSGRCRIPGKLFLLFRSLVGWPIFIFLPPWELHPMHSLPTPDPNHPLPQLNHIRVQNIGFDNTKYRWCPRAMASQAQDQPKIAGSGRNRLDFETKKKKKNHQKLSFSLLLLGLLYILFLCIFLASLFLSTLRFHTTLYLIYTRNSRVHRYVPPWIHSTSKMNIFTPVL